MARDFSFFFGTILQISSAGLQIWRQALFWDKGRAAMGIRRQSLKDLRNCPYRAGPSSERKALSASGEAWAPCEASARRFSSMIAKNGGIEGGRPEKASPLSPRLHIGWCPNEASKARLAVCSFFGNMLPMSLRKGDPLALGAHYHGKAKSVTGRPFRPGYASLLPSASKEMGKAREWRRYVAISRNKKGPA
jgi:hypothetical protein